MLRLMSPTLTPTSAPKQNPETKMRTVMNSKTPGRLDAASPLLNATTIDSADITAMRAVCLLFTWLDYPSNAYMVYPNLMPTKGQHHHR